MSAPIIRPRSDARLAEPRRTGAGAWLRALRIVHPFPTLLNVAATVGLAFVAERGVPDAGRLSLMAVVMFCAQSAIGVVNDYYDRELDAVAKPWKPIPAGLVSAPAAVIAALGLIGAAAAAAAPLGLASFALAMLGLACGLAYDARLKRSAFSALPFAVALPTLPIWVWVTLDAWQPVCLWLIPLGGLLGVAVHLANTLPDIESDAAAGVSGLAHRLGGRRSMLVAWGSFAAALALSLVLSPIVEYDVPAYAATLLAGGIALAAGAGMSVLARGDTARQLSFGLLSLASVVLAVGWLAAAT